jgi:hypothetical protein
VSNTKKPRRPLLTLKGRLVKHTPKPPGKDSKPLEPKAPPKPKGPAYTPPRQPVERLERFWLVMRDNGRRPKARHESLASAQEEARRIAATCPGAQVWVIECLTVETVAGGVP